MLRQVCGCWKTWEFAATRSAKRYTRTRSIGCCKSSTAPGANAYDFVDQMVINDLEDFKKGLMDGKVRETLTSIHAMEGRWIDHSQSDYWFSVDVPQVFTAEPCVATWSNTLLKVFYVPRRLRQLSLAEALFHWNSCHGAMARQVR